MSLIAYKRPTREVPLDNSQSFKVHGLSGSDFRMLIESNLDSFEVIFGLFDKTMGMAKTPDALNNKFLQDAALALVQNVPAFAPAAIALAADEEGDFVDKLEAAGRLPMPVQISTLLDIAALTFEEVGGVKKFIEKFKGLMPVPTTQPKLETQNKKKSKAPSSGSTTESDET